ncbi:L-lactate permease [Leptolyngbya sp. O-77]|uniref:L-lactate permease n=1 Tax=Leptolyngbya sp. O-77 TaxID=1080068 RepID=UPI00257099AC|nr:L-lactate permease [Leptolyngbya sp. O-77]
MLHFLFAALPILTVFVLLLGARLSAGRAMPIAYLVTVAIALWIWARSTGFGCGGLLVSRACLLRWKFSTSCLGRCCC